MYRWKQRVSEERIMEEANRGRNETGRKIGEEKEVKEKVTHLSDNDDDETASS